MEIREYGQDNQKTLLLLPPKYMTGKVFELLIRNLKEDWHIFCVSYDGFQDHPDCDFTTCAAQAQKLEKLLAPVMPFDVVYGHGLGASVALELDSTHAKKVFLAGVDLFSAESTHDMLQMVMPRRHYKLLQKMDEPVSPNEIDSILLSKLPYSIWKEVLPENVSGISKQSVENAVVEDLDFEKRLEKSHVFDKYVLFYGDRQHFKEDKMAELAPAVEQICLEKMGQDDLLFRPDTFKNLLKNYA
jgi:hypothetical protein